MIPEDIHLRIRAVRREFDYFQEYLAKLVKIDQQAISDIENGKKSISEELLFKIAKAMNVSSDYIIAKEYNQPVQINNTNCSGNVGCNHVSIVNDNTELISEVKSIFEKMQVQTMKGFEEILVKLVEVLKK